MCPQADVFTLLDYLPVRDRGFLRGHRVATSFLQGWPGSRRRHRHFLPLMPLAIEQFDIGDYDLVISNSHSVAQGVLTHAEQHHVAYVNRTMRYAWDLYHSDLRRFRMNRGLRGLSARLVYHYVRQWDWLAFQRPQTVLANSEFVARRLRRTYRRDSEVIPPPVDTDFFRPAKAQADGYIYVGRLVPYKRPDLAVQVCTQRGCRLRVVGDGPLLVELQKQAGPTIEFLGWRDRKEVANLLSRSWAFLQPGVEEFGIAPLEAQACGIPVIALARGGAAETMNVSREGVSAVLFEEPTVESMAAAMDSFEAGRAGITAGACRRNAERFSAEQFRARLGAAIEQVTAGAVGEQRAARYAGA